ncbi:poly-beta-1,6-N-acetyl-D-glucosamine N-deacetylase PgaB [Litchfieldella xinjiangensis]|uniref:poly-beta-1,6-N-acetyl-D-glucosamine N-deacetylase PgaB n=1 Tax=Litchfieldella xinjiangensis TaxID=1166948 RepID=UPI0005BAC8E6
MRAFAALVLVWLCVLSASAQAARQPNDFVVISYHDIVDLAATPDLQVFPQTITRDTLIQHFDLIERSGYHPVSFDQILEARQGGRPLPDRAVLLTFDDGYRSFYDIVYPLLKLYRFPAIIAVVGSWLDVPAGSNVPYGDTQLPRERFLTWEQLREMQESGFVEVASHSYDLHHGIPGNPYRNLQAAAATSRWNEESGYESEADYLARIENDMHKSSEQITERMGVPPRLMVWPYGAFNQAALDIAAAAGMSHTFSLFSEINHVEDDTREIGRYLVDQETSLKTYDEILSGQLWDPEILRIVHVDLDYVYDEDEQQQARNLDILLDRIKRYGITTVYLQAFADPDGNGVADALYFPNRHLPMREDLFNRVAWQLKKRANVKVYAWMPVMAFDLGSDYTYVSDARHDGPAPDQYLRLSPFVGRNRQVIVDIYEDLGRLTKFDGLLFHDDALLGDYEDSGDAALSWYGDQWRLAEDIESIRQDPMALQQWTQHKTQFLIDLTHDLTEAANHYRLADNKRFTTSRNIYAPLIMTPHSEQWFAQNMEAFSQAYDYVAVMAMPYMEGIEHGNATAWLKTLAEKSLQRVPASRLIFELQTMDWRDQTPIDSHELASWMQAINKVGIQHYGYYPDDFHNNHPDANVLRRHFSLKRNIGETP